MFIGLIIIIFNFALISFDYNLGLVISLVVGIALTIYAAYDAYLCANAINESREIPSLFNMLNIE